MCYDIFLCFVGTFILLLTEKNIENQFTFGKVAAENNVSSFYGTQCMYRCTRCQENKERLHFIRLLAEHCNYKSDTYISAIIDYKQFCCCLCGN